jgi:hypothetical protein
LYSTAVVAAVLQPGTGNKLPGSPRFGKVERSVDLSVAFLPKLSDTLALDEQEVVVVAADCVILSII